MELIKGEIYTSTLDGNIYIWRCDKTGNYSNDARLLLQKVGSHLFEINVGFHGWRNVRQSTPTEKAWLEACIEAKKLVPTPEAGINYEIY